MNVDLYILKLVFWFHKPNHEYNYSVSNIALRIYIVEQALTYISVEIYKKTTCRGLCYITTNIREVNKGEIKIHHVCMNESRQSRELIN